MNGEQREYFIFFRVLWRFIQLFLRFCWDIVQRLVGVLTVIAIVGILVGPFLYLEGGKEALIAGLIACYFISWFTVRCIHQRWHFLEGCAAGLAGALGIGLVFMFSERRLDSSTLGAGCLGLVWSFAIGFGRSIGEQPTQLLPWVALRNIFQDGGIGFVLGLSVVMIMGRPVMEGFAFTAVTFGLVTSLIVAFEAARCIQGVARSLAVGLCLILTLCLLKVFNIPLPWAVVAGATGAIGFLLGLPVGYLLRVPLLEAFDLLIYLKPIGRIVAGLAIVYFLLIFVFAGIFGTAWITDRDGAFTGGGFPKVPSFWDFFYFSTVTIATLGYGDITPGSTTTKLLVSLEVILGIGWIAVGVGWAIALFQSSFPEIAQKITKRRQERQQEGGTNTCSKRKDYLGDGIVS